MGDNILERGLGHLSKYKPLLYELVVRDLKVKYRRSFLGYLWSLMNPLLMMLIMTVIFSYMFRFDIPNYPLYLICGQTLWTCFNEATTMSMTSVIQNGALIKKIYIPKFIFPLSRVISSFVTMLFSLMAILLVMILTRTEFHLEILIFWVPLALMFFFAFGISLILSGVAVRFRDITHLYGVLTMAWMYATPIFYPVNQVPVMVQYIIKLNPMYHYINCFRELVLYGNICGPNTWFACIASGVLALGSGLYVFGKMQKDFILYI